MSTNIIATLLSVGWICICAIAAFIFVFMKYKKTKAQINRCSKQLHVKCIDMEINHVHSRRDVDGEFHSGHTTWIPTFAGTVNGKEILYRPTKSVSGCYTNIEEGDYVDIMINPENPSEWVGEIETTMLPVYIMGMIVAVVFSAGFIYLGISSVLH